MNMNDEISALLHLCASNLDQREHWLNLSQAFYEKRDYLSGYWAAKQALAIKETADDKNLSYPYDLAGTCAYYIRMYDEARDLSLEAWRKAPFDKRIILNTKLMRRHLNDYKIHILWPTVRPKIFKERYKEWQEKACLKDRIKLKIAVNTEEQREELNEFPDVKIIGTNQPGVAYASYMLSKDLLGLPDDIVILASDDFSPPKDWDAWIYDKLNGFHGALLVNDTVNREGVITIPIMDYACLLFTNKIIYHPSYVHLWSDNEYYNNLNYLGLIKNLQQPDQPVFEHRHWYQGKREKDEIDENAHKNMDRDQRNYEARIRLSFEQKICQI